MSVWKLFKKFIENEEDDEKVFKQKLKEKRLKKKNKFREIKGDLGP